LKYPDKNNLSDMASIFSKIVSGEIPSYKVAEDEHFLAFLDINPLAKGHLLVIPKKEVDYIFDIDDALYAAYFVFAKKVAVAMKKVIPCAKIGVAVLGLEVPHAHIHLIPINGIYDIDFSKPKLKFSQAEFEEIATLISEAME
jgi:histidine triad (HIT) family protein